MIESKISNKLWKQSNQGRFSADISSNRDGLRSTILSNGFPLEILFEKPVHVATGRVTHVDGIDHTGRLAKCPTVPRSPQCSRFAVMSAGSVESSVAWISATPAIVRMVTRKGMTICAGSIGASQASMSRLSAMNWVEREPIL